MSDYTTMRACPEKHLAVLAAILHAVAATLALLGHAVPAIAVGFIAFLLVAATSFAYGARRTAELYEEVIGHDR